MMKKRIALVMAVIISSTVLTNPVKAEGVASATATAANVSTQAVEKGMEQYIINEIKGRAGAASPTGAKGIVFEKMVCIKQNVTNVFKGAKTKFTKCSTAKTVDLVTVDKNGKVLERIQCKDASASAKNVVKQVESGKYNSAQLVGTKESAKEFNKEAAKKGVKKVMKDSGISSKDTQRVAQKALGEQTTKSVAESAGKAGAVGAVISGGVALVESIKNGDDFGDTTGNVTYSSMEGAISGITASLAGDAATAIIVMTGASGTVTVLVPIAIAAGAGTITYMVFENVDKNCDVRGMIADAADYVKDGALEFTNEAKVVIPEMASDAKEITCVWMEDTADVCQKWLSSVTDRFENKEAVISKIPEDELAESPIMNAVSRG